ncbi:MAG: cyclic nucleotide-binding domain-containing protein [Rhodospirillaceae bacterium]|nr:cyclic nucleotide-binding domain-containing protein [Rhodospirillaceae bacterium]
MAASTAPIPDLAGLPVARFDEKAVIFLHGEPADDAYLLVSGQVAILAPNAAGELVQFAVVAPGQIFGEMALIMNAPRTAMAVAEVTSVCVAINREALAREMAKADPFLRFWINYMSGRLADVSQRAGR